MSQQNVLVFQVSLVQYTWVVVHWALRYRTIRYTKISEPYDLDEKLSDRLTIDTKAS